MAYNSSHTGAQIDAAVGAVREKESTWDGKQDKLTGAAGKLVGFTDKDTVGPVDAPSGIDAVDSAPSTAAQDSLSVDPNGIAYTGNSSGAAVMQYGTANVTVSDAEPSETLPEGHIWMVYE